MIASEYQSASMPAEQSSAQEEQGQGEQVQDEQAQEEKAPSRRILYPKSIAKRTTTAKFARLQHRKGPTDQWEDLEQAYEAQVDQSTHPEPYNVQRMTNSILGIAVRQYPEEAPQGVVDEPLSGWAVKFANVNMSDITLGEYAAGKKEFCSIRFKCTGPPESHPDHMLPKVHSSAVDQNELNKQAADLPLAKLFLQPEAMVGMEFRITVPKGSTRPDKQNCWLWPMIVWFLMSTTWDGAGFQITDSVSRGELGQWARANRGLPAGATLKELSGPSPAEWSLEREEKVLGKNHRRAEARPPGPAKLSADKREEQKQAGLQLPQRPKAHAVSSKRSRADVTKADLEAEIDSTRYETAEAAAKRHVALEKFKAAQKELNEATKDFEECSARHSGAKVALEALIEEENRYKK